MRNNLISPAYKIVVDFFGDVLIFFFGWTFQSFVFLRSENSDLPYSIIRVAGRRFESFPVLQIFVVAANKIYRLKIFPDFGFKPVIYHCEVVVINVRTDAIIVCSINSQHFVNVRPKL